MEFGEIPNAKEYICLVKSLLDRGDRDKDGRESVVSEGADEVRRGSRKQ